MFKPNRRCGAWLIVVVVYFGFTACGVDPQVPANPNTNETARALLRYLHDLPNRPNKRVISGQRLHDFYGDDARYTPPTTNHPLGQVFNKTGQWPGIVSAEYTNWRYSGTNQRVIWRELNPVLIDYWKKGGLVELHFHPIGPSGALGTPKENLDAILNSDGTFNTTYMALLDQAVAGLRNLQDNGVVVLWRPVHDFAGPFWWGGSPDRHRRVWKHMFNYFKGKGLNNLLWVLSSYGTGAHRDYWAGPQYVDILGVDWGVDWPTFDRQVAGARGLGKPLAITQTGESNGKIFDLTLIINTIRNRAPEVTFFIEFSTGVDFAGVGWDQSIGSGPSGPSGSALMNDPWVINRGEIDFRDTPTPRR